MRVRIERRGGLVGAKAVGERDLAELTAAQRDALDKLVRSSPDPTPSPGYDRFTYTVQLKNDDGSEHLKVTVPEDKMPDTLAQISKIPLP